MPNFVPNFDQYTQDKPANQATAKGEQTTAADRLLAEANLLLGTPLAVAQGTADRLVEIYEDPLKAVPPLLLGAGLGAGLAAVARGGQCGTVIRHLGKYAAVAAGADLAVRTAPAIYNTWNTPELVDEQKKLLGKNLGGLVVDYGLMGVGGYAGGKLFIRGNGLIPGAPLTQTETEKLSHLIRTEFKKPNGLSHLDFSDPKVIQELTNAMAGKPSTLPVKELQDAVKSIENAVNKWTAARGLPKVEVNWYAPNGRSFGNAPWDVSKVNIEASVLAKRSPMGLSDVVVHELTHIDQHVTAMRRLADKLGIGATASSAELTALSNEYKRTYGHTNPNVDFMKEVIRLRNGKPLSTAQAHRADEFLSRHQSTHETYLAQVNARTRDNLLGEALKTTTTTPAGARTFIKQLNDKDFCKSHFGTERPPVLLDPIVKYTVSGKPWSTAEAEQAQRVLKNVLTAEKALAVQELNLQNTRYLNLPGEQEAMRAGHLAAWDTYMSTTPRLVKLGLSVAATGDLLSQGTDFTRRNLLPLLIPDAPTKK